LYEYQCVKCGRKTEKIEGVDGPHLRKCPHCGGKVERLVTAPAIQFKGAGWYVTDYAKKSSGGDSEKSGSRATEAAGKESAKEKTGDSEETGSRDSKEKKSAKKK
jgi:putative FmdB family regulatory protein